MAESKAIINYAQVNCYIKRLKIVEKLEADYPEFNVEDQIESCANYTKILEEEVYKKLALSVRHKTDFGKYTKCIMNDLRSRNWVDDIMKQAVYLASDTLTDAEKTMMVDEIEDNVEKSAVEAFNYCIFDKEFGEVFDEFFKTDDSSSEEDEDPVTDYCARKYVIDKSLIDTALYNVILNPKNLDISAVNCEENLKNTFKQIQDVILKTIKEEEDFRFDANQMECAMEKYRQGSFIDNFIVIAVLSELKLTDEQKRTERKRFIDSMGLTTSKVNDC
jgi:hypothetical protein